MAIEIVDFPIKKGDFPLKFVSSPEGSFLKIIKTTNDGDVSHEKETSLWRTSQTT